MSAELRREWLCSGCSMRVYNACHDPIPPPIGWNLTTDRCLTCSTEDEDPHDYAVRMILEGRSNGRIYAKGISNKWLDAKRQELIESGDLDPVLGDPPPQSGPHGVHAADAHLVPVIEEALRADPTESNASITTRVGARQATVSKVRKGLGIRPAKKLNEEQRDEGLRRVLEEHPDTSNGEMGRRLRCSPRKVWGVRDRLGLPQPTVKRGPKPRAAQSS